MKSALVIGSSGGIGAAVLHALQKRGVQADGLSRYGDGLDITDETSVQQHMSSLQGPYELIFVATGVLAAEGAAPEKAIDAVTPGALLNQFMINAVGPMMVLKHARRLLPKDRRSVFAVLSARVGSIEDNQIGGWHSYRTSKAALNQLIKGAAIELKRTHKQTIAVCLHPGTVATPFTRDYAARHKTVPPEQASANLLSVIDGLGPDNSGSFLDYSGQEIPW